MEGCDNRHRRDRPDAGCCYQQADSRMTLGNCPDTTVERDDAGEDIAPGGFDDVTALRRHQRAKVGGHIIKAP